MAQDTGIDALVAHSTALADECQAIADSLAKHADKLHRRRQIMRSLSLAIGLLAILVAYVPTVTELVDPLVSQLLPAVAALTLVVGSSLFLVGVADPPERFRDYAHYIRYYHMRISEIITYKDKITLEAQLKEINILAQENIRDARTKWPTLLEGARTTLLRKQSGALSDTNKYES